MEIYEINEEIKSLAQKYIENKILTEKYKEDALHIAAATILKVDVLVSWNFKHIANIYKINKYNSINLFYNYKIIDIRTPMEVLSYED